MEARKRVEEGIKHKYVGAAFGNSNQEAQEGYRTHNMYK